MSDGRRGCSICKNPVKKDFVNRKLAMGLSLNAVEKATGSLEAQELGITTPVKYETVKKHRDGCLLSLPNVDTAVLTTAQTQVLGQTAASVAIGEGDPDDLAILVRKEVANKLRAGEVRVTVQHGLIAQGMLDKRREKEREMALALTIARALGTFAATPPANLIDAVVRDVTDS